MPDHIETDIDDLTDGAVADVLFALSPTAYDSTRPERERPVLREIVSCLDRASPNWPVTVLGLPTVEQLVHG